MDHPETLTIRAHTFKLNYPFVMSLESSLRIYGQAQLASSAKRSRCRPRSSTGEDGACWTCHRCFAVLRSR